MSKILVTGGTGFIGSHLLEYLLDSGEQVVALVRPHSGVRKHPGLEIHRGDLLDPGSLNGCCEDVDIVYHLAAHPSLGTRNSETLSINSTGTKNLLQEVRKSGTVERFILMSSLAAAGSRPGKRLTEISRELDVAQPDTPYGRSKLQAEAFTREVCTRDGIPYVILRPGLVYGPGSPPDGGMNALVGTVKSGSLLARFDLPGKVSVVHVGDLIQACLIVAKHPFAAGRTFFVSDSHPVSFGEIFKTVRKQIGRSYHPIPITEGFCSLARNIYNWLDRTLAISHVIPSYMLAPLGSSLACNSNEIRSQLGFEAQYTLSHGMANTLRNSE
jgi:nucleoside-diphosphate-sugar epimerase